MYRRRNTVSRILNKIACLSPHPRGFPKPSKGGRGTIVSFDKNFITLYIRNQHDFTPSIRAGWASLAHKESSFNIIPSLRIRGIYLAERLSLVALTQFWKATTSLEHCNGFF